MEIVENNAAIWDSIWDSDLSQDRVSIQKSIDSYKKSKEWVAYTDIVDKKFGGWKNVKAIEIGSGMGWHSFLAATEGAEITLLDYSEPALKRAEERLNLFSLKANYLFGNAFELIKNNKEEYNLSWSFGTVEHFKNDLRQHFFQLHFDYIIKGGLTIMSSPYKYAVNYRLWMYYANKYNDWNYGLEIPYSKTEFQRKLKKSGNKLLTVLYSEGRPCLNKMMKILKNNSSFRYSLFYLPIKIHNKLRLRITPFFFRSIILIAEKIK